MATCPKCNGIFQLCEFTENIDTGTAFMEHCKRCRNEVHLWKALRRRCERPIDSIKNEFICRAIIWTELKIQHEALTQDAKRDILYALTRCSAWVDPPCPPSPSNRRETVAPTSPPSPSTKRKSWQSSHRDKSRTHPGRKAQRQEQKEEGGDEEGNEAEQRERGLPAQEPPSQPGRRTEESAAPVTTPTLSAENSVAEGGKDDDGEGEYWGGGGEEDENRDEGKEGRKEEGEQGPSDVDDDLVVTGHVIFVSDSESEKDVDETPSPPIRDDEYDADDEDNGKLEPAANFFNPRKRRCVVLDPENGSAHRNKRALTSFER